MEIKNIIGLVKEKMLDAIEECREFDLALAQLGQELAAAEKHFDDMSTYSKEIAMAITMSQEEAAYYLSGILQERIW